KVYDNYYGIPKSEIKGALEIGTNVIIKADVQGSATIKKIAPDAILIFLIPPSLEELSERLLRRHGQYSSDLELRLKTAEEEMQQLDIFDYVISSTKDNIDLIVSKIQAIITTEKCRVNPRIVNL
ncbi:MAG TPA: guanylate kinase, partial [Dehalococcoidia bacterium]|nr:guanylate kinase [Dehalococcoidia bacterium]